MAPQKDTVRTAASAGNLDDTAYFGVVDSALQLVKATFAQMKTALGTVSSMSGDVSASVAAGVATTTIGALKVATGMIQATAVTYAKIQNVSAQYRLLGRTTSGAGSVEEISVNTTYLSLVGGTLAPAADIIAQIKPVLLAADQSISSTTLADVTSMSLAVAANTSYAFEFQIRYNPGSSPVDPRFSVSCPASPTAFNALVQYGINGTTTLGLAEYSERIAASNGGTGMTGVTDASQDHFATVRGVIRNGSNAGAVKLRVAGTSSASFWNVNAGTSGRLVVLV